MSIWQTKTSMHRTRRVKRQERSLYRSAKMFNEAFDKVFCAKRPWMRWNSEPSFTADFGRRPQAGKELQRRVAKTIVAMEHLEKGVIKRMAEGNGLNVTCLYAAVRYERRRQRLAKQRTAA